MQLSDFTPLGISYSIHVEMSTFERLLAIERESNDTLYWLLGQIPGVKNIDYDGHFGNVIYLSIENDCDLIATKKRIMEVITERLTHAS